MTTALLTVRRIRATEISVGRQRAGAAIGERRDRRRASGEEVIEQIGRVCNVRRVVAVRVRGGDAAGGCYTDKQPVEDAHAVCDVDLAVVVAVAAEESCRRSQLATVFIGAYIYGDVAWSLMAFDIVRWSAARTASIDCRRGELQVIIAWFDDEVRESIFTVTNRHRHKSIEVEDTSLHEQWVPVDIPASWPYFASFNSGIGDLRIGVR